MGTLRELHTNPRFTKYLIEKKVFDKDHMVVVDVGARKGFEKHWGYYGNQVELIGFEPNADSFEECVRNKSNKQTKYYPYALDCHKGEKDFYITANPSASGFYRPDLKCVSKYGMEKSYKIINTIKLKTIDFDSFKHENQIPSIDFMKLDTEGSELDILKGAESSLISEVLGLSIETEFIRTHIGQPLFSDIDQYLRSLGFQLYDLDLNRWSRKALKSIDSSFGQLHFAQSLYLREAASELENIKDNKQYWVDLRVLKMASIMELFFLPDCAIELIQKASKLGLFENNNVDYLIDLLVPQNKGKNISYKDYLLKVNVEKPIVSLPVKNRIKKIFDLFPQPIRKVFRFGLLIIRNIVNHFKSK